jgi:hypothetical protein
MSKLNCVAYYLGQFHPTDENNRFWGEGFTEWHNVAKARPLYPGHRQPILPGKFGFYDLRCDQSLLDQISFARSIGVDAFCHWHYWFAGKRLLHLPLDRMLNLDPSFKFMLGWANESWSGIWHGQSSRVLIKQTYDYSEMLDHADLLASYIHTGSYLECDGVYPFVIYKPRLIPRCLDYLQALKSEVLRRCGAELYLVGNWTPGRAGRISFPSELGLDAVVVTPVAAYYTSLFFQNLHSLVWQGLRKFCLGPEVRKYSTVNKTLQCAISSIHGVAHATVVTGWDNTPRSGRRGLVLSGFNHDNFAKSVECAIYHEMHNQRKLLFVKSWNEWAEGNVLEPVFNESWSTGDSLRRALTGIPD